jgi:hypothetical protein
MKSSKTYSKVNMYISSSKQVLHNQEMLPLAGYWPFDAIISYFTPIKEAVLSTNISARCRTAGSIKSMTTSIRRLI